MGKLTSKELRKMISEAVIAHLSEVPVPPEPDPHVVASMDEFGDALALALVYQLERHRGVFSDMVNGFEDNIDLDDVYLPARVEDIETSAADAAHRAAESLSSDPAFISYLKSIARTIMMRTV